MAADQGLIILQKLKLNSPPKWPCILTRPVLHIFIPRWQFIVRICLSIPYIAKFLPRHLTIEWSKGPLLLQGPKGFLLGTLGPAASLWLHDLWPWLDPSVHTSAPIFKIMKVLAFIRFNVSTKRDYFTITFFFNKLVYWSRYISTFKNGLTSSQFFFSAILVKRQHIITMLPVNNNITWTCPHS